jgi:holliday junction DNA helicase RuvA
MIASLQGTVGVRCPDHVVVECGGVGYRLNVSAQTLQKVPAVGGQARLLSQLVVRDDALHLYGFATEDERELFLKLISVAGVGPKMALAVLSGSSAGELGKAIASGDAKRFQVVPGVGKKTAERIIVELREKIPEALAAGLSGSNGSQDSRTLAREGLVGLGYDLAEAEAMLDAIGEDLDEGEPEQLIAAALRAAVTGDRR